MYSSKVDCFRLPFSAVFLVEVDALAERVLLDAGLVALGLVTPLALGDWAAILAFAFGGALGFGEESFVFFLEAPVAPMVGGGG